MSKPSPIRKSRQRDQLILALLQQPGIEKAAAVAGISSATAWRITKTREFVEEYRACAPQRILPIAGPASYSQRFCFRVRYCRPTSLASVARTRGARPNSDLR
jgi:hypothetical protein